MTTRARRAPQTRRRRVLRRSPGSSSRSAGLSSSRARFAARASQVRRRPWLLVSALVVALSLVAGAVWLVELSPVLVARSVRVEGVPPGDVPKILDLAAVPIGTPLAKVDTRAVARRVVVWATLAQVTVTRSWPSTVVVTARVRVPVLAVKNPQGLVQVVDSEGVVYATVSESPEGVPLVETAEDPPSKESMRAALTVLGALSPSQRDRVSDVTVSGPNEVALRLGGVNVVWGGASEPALKVKVLTVLLRRKGVETIDVSAPRTPSIR